MTRIIGWIEYAAIIVVLGIAAWTAMEIIKVFLGQLPAMIFAGCLVVLGVIGLFEETRT